VYQKVIGKKLADGSVVLTPADVTLLNQTIDEIYRNIHGGINGKKDIRKGSITAEQLAPGTIDPDVEWTDVLNAPLAVIPYQGNDVAILPGSAMSNIIIDGSGEDATNAEGMASIHSDANLAGSLGTNSYRWYNGYAGAWITTSSQKYKEDIQPFILDGQIEKAKKLNLYKYKLKRAETIKVKLIEKKKELPDIQTGVLTEEAKDIAPEFVDKHGEGIDLYSYTSFVLSVVKELITEVETLKQKLSDAKIV
jgi:hypothetical protein